LFGEVEDTPGKEGHQWYFGMKAHMDVDVRTRLIHSVAATAENVAEARIPAALLHGSKRAVYSEQAHQGHSNTIRGHARSRGQNEPSLAHQAEELPGSAK
jgi:IS5 family transposase